jgi:uncharacterized protein YlxW (UPF0749 family)
MTRTFLRQSLLTIMCIGIGFILVTQLRTYETISSDVRNLSPEERSVVIIGLIDRNNSAEREIETLRAQNADYERAKSDGSSNLQKLVDDLNRLRAQTGAVQVRGTGVLITVDYALRAADVMALINEIRNASAEAIAINNQRIIARTTIDEQNGVLLINGTPQAPPYQVAALGDSNTLMGALNRIGGLLRIWNEIDGVSVRIEPSDNLILPRISSAPAFRYAQPAP